MIWMGDPVGAAAVAEPVPDPAGPLVPVLGPAELLVPLLEHAASVSAATATAAVAKLTREAARIAM
jgi:hypothetical protein